MVKTTCIICGKSFIGCAVLQYIVDANTLYSLPVTPYVLPMQGDIGVDTWQPSLRKLAQVTHTPFINSITELPLTNHTLILSLEYDKIIPVSSLGNARAYNIHFSNLPKYRGCLTSTWPIRNKERKAGVTLHVLTEPVDSGDIVDQIVFPIPPWATSFDLYRLYSLYGFELFKKNYAALLSGKLNPVAQDTKKSTYYFRSSIDFHDRDIRAFDMPAMRVAGFVRSLIFAPYQLPMFHNKPVIQCDTVSFKIPGQQLAAGRVALEDATHAIIACQDGYVRLFFQTR